VISSQLVDLGAVLEDSGEVAQVAAGELHVPRRQRVADVRRVQRVRLLPLHLPEMKSLLDGYSRPLLVKMLLLFNLNISGRMKEGLSHLGTTLEPDSSSAPLADLLPADLCCCCCAASMFSGSTKFVPGLSKLRPFSSCDMFSTSPCSVPKMDSESRQSFYREGYPWLQQGRKGEKRLQFIALLAEQAESDFSVGKFLQIRFCCNWRQIILLVETAMR